MKRLFLVDVSSLFFRAFFAIRQLTNSQGIPTNALYGFLSMTIKLLREEKPDYLAFCFDSKEPSFRKEIYPEYKAHRTEMPDELQQQMPFLYQMTEVLGVPIFKLPGMEADDLIGTVAKWGAAKGWDVSIVSGDKDFAQLVDAKISMVDTMKDLRIDRQGVFEKWGVWPEQFVDYLSLVGDTSDNIPGVAGIGPKGAQNLLADYTTLENIYENIDTVRPDGVRAKLIASRENAFVSKKLSQIKTDIDLNLSVEKVVLNPMDRVGVSELLKKLEFKAFESKLLGDGSADAPHVLRQSASPDQSEKIVLQSSSPEEFLNLDLSGKEIWAITSREGLSLIAEKNITTLKGDQNTGNSDWENILKNLVYRKCRFSGWDLKELFRKNAIPLSEESVSDDVAIATYLTKPGASLDLNVLLERFSGQLPDSLTPEKIWTCLIKIKEQSLQTLNETNTLSVYRDMDLAIVSVLCKMELRGILLDPQVLSEQLIEVDIDLKRIETEVIKHVGEPFSLTSPKQLSHILFEKLKMPPGKKTKTGFSTDSDVLQKLSHQFPICLKILEHRELSKLKSTYLESLPQLVDPKDGRLHSHFNQMLTTTGRLSSHTPNLQNIPIRTPRGNAIRNAFIPAEGYRLISADYSQIELRVLAHISEDPAMIRAFENGQDIHSSTASEVFGVGLDQVTADQRRVAKEVNFGIAYGMGVFGLAENLSMSRTDAQAVITGYFKKFPNIQTYMTSIVEFAKENGFVSTLFGRRRYIDELKSKNGAVRKFGERAAINAPIQGTAADLVKKAMIAVSQDELLKDYLILQVHDELILEAPENLVEKVEARIRELMANVVRLKVPLLVSVNSGKSWYQAHG